MAKITISNLETAEISLQQLTATELDATKGGLLDNLTVKDVNVISKNEDDADGVDLSGLNNLLRGLTL